MQGTLSISKLKKLFTLSVTLKYCKVGKTTKGQVYQYRILIWKMLYFCPKTQNLKEVHILFLSKLKQL